MLKSIVAALGAFLVLAGAANVHAEPEKKKIVLGLSLPAVTFMPIYVAEQEGYFADEGLEVEVTPFNGGSKLARALIADNVDVGMVSLATIALTIKAGQPIKAFYAGFNVPALDWYAVKDITSFEQTKGRRLGVGNLGAATDLLTRYALKLHGIDPEKDVQIIPGGRAAERMPAMETGQLDVNIVGIPGGYVLRDRGFNHILSQKDIAPDFPLHMSFAKEDFIAANPDTIRALLRAIVRGMRKAKEDKAVGVAATVAGAGYEKHYTEEAYDDVITQLHEDGRMPSEAGMKAFWEVGMMAGLYEEPWPEERYLDRTFIDSYDEWKPGD